MMRQAKHANPQAVASLCENMQPDFLVSPSGPTFVRLLKECITSKDLERGTQIHAEVARKGLLDKNVNIGTTLVDMYAKCGLPVRAQQVFDKLPERNIVSWTTLIGGYANNDRSEEALWYFECMQEAGIPTNFVTFNCCLTACRTIKALDKGQAIHSEIERQGLLETNLVIANTLVDMYAKCGQLNEAHYVLIKLPLRNVITWKALIAGYVEYGHYKKALDCWEQIQREGVPPDAATYVAVLKACGMLGDIHKGEALHKMMESSGLLEGHFLLGSNLVSMYSRCGLLAKAQHVFDRLSVRNADCWNSLLGAYAENGHDEKVLKCHEQMKLEGVSPNFTTLICALNACGKVKDTVKGGEIHKDAERQGMLEEPVLGNALVDMYAKSGLLLIARKIFDALSVQTIVSWNALIAGYAEHGQGRKALDCFEQMQIEGVSPMLATFFFSLKACSSTKNMQKCEELHAEIERQGLLDSNLPIGNTLIDVYAKLGLVSLLQEVFDRLPARDVVTWAVLIGGYTEHGLGEEVLRQFQHMQSDGIGPNAVTYNLILKTCCTLGILAKGQEIHAEIEMQELLKRNVLIGPTLIELYSECGSLAKAEEVFNKLPAKINACWSALI
ncbi:hypothetical protein GOP47_0024094 [Adiantum capillus-veneris]|uniref:Pentatricopeptide repeat-containing protein n=1 Tax=Adiantum capillus-veneris TaxID=13818 RepID=A0A9D4U6V7_ADICA|nr:hypothetical protein GOP47_0024094 [Adiantum capillus-veneris]